MDAKKTLSLALPQLQAFSTFVALPRIMNDNVASSIKQQAELGWKALRAREAGSKHMQKNPVGGKAKCQRNRFRDMRERERGTQLDNFV